MTTDSNVTRVCEKMQNRAKVGLKKYGTTTDRKDYTLVDWLINAQEESMDHTIYTEAAMKMARQLQAESDQWRDCAKALAKSSRELLDMVPVTRCADFHHSKKDQHEYGEVCKPLERWNAKIASARDAITKFNELAIQKKKQKQ